MSHTTSAGVAVIPLDGEAGPIHDRARQIKALSTCMSDSAIRIVQIANGEARGVGFSMDSLRQIGDELGSDLERASDLYQRGGEAYQSYAAAALEMLKPSVDRQVGVVDGRYVTWMQLDAAAKAAVDPAAKAALEIAASEAWAKYLVAKDVEYQALYIRWREISDTRSDRLSSACDDLADGIGAQLNGILDKIVTGASYVAVGAGLISLVFPPAGTVALIAAGVAFAGTAVLYAQGEKTGVDLGFAAIGILPVMSIGRVATSAFRAASGTQLARPLAAGVNGVVGDAQILRAAAQWSVPALRNATAAGARQAVDEGIWQITKPLTVGVGIRNAQTNQQVFQRMIGNGHSADQVRTLQNGLERISFTRTEAGKGRLGALASDVRAPAVYTGPEVRGPLGPLIQQTPIPGAQRAAAEAIEGVNTLFRRTVIGAQGGMDTAFREAFETAAKHHSMTPSQAQGMRDGFFEALSRGGGGNVPDVFARQTQRWLETPLPSPVLDPLLEWPQVVALNADRLTRVLAEMQLIGGFEFGQSGLRQTVFEMLTGGRP